MTAVQNYLSNDFPEQGAALQRICRENPAFALKIGEYETLSQLIISGNLAPNDLEELKQKHAMLKRDITRHLRHATGSCCGGCGG